MATPSHPRLLVLHGLRLRGFGEPADVAAIVGVDEQTVAEHLDKAAADGHALRREGPRLSGWALTAEGRAEQERLLAEELVAAGVEPVVRMAYERFLGMNSSLLSLCTDWQMVDEATLNDHSDPGYDQAVLDRLHAHHEGAEPILDDLEGALARYARFRPRFAGAIERLMAGEGDFFTKPMIDSYHTVWFQLHEDLLNTLGIERSKESIR